MTKNNRLVSIILSITGLFTGINIAQAQNTTEKHEDDLPAFSPTEAQLYNSYLVQVSNVSVETAVGVLPRLPSYVQGTYKDGKNGPKVRVVWPAPVDNTEVLRPGSYTVIGVVAATEFRPKATVTVKQMKESTEPDLKLKTFDLNQVSLNVDSHGHESKFVENRDKFITTLPMLFSTCSVMRSVKNNLKVQRPWECGIVRIPS